MCLQTSSVRSSQKWHWAGDAIVHDPSIPASRSIPGSGKKRYAIDVRGFLSIEGNAVVRHHLEELVAGLSESDRVFFQSRFSGQWWRWYSTFPSDLKNRPDFPGRRCLPDQDMIAVDGPTKGSNHRRYNAADYTMQFRLRYDAAVRHVRKIYSVWKAKL